jgi:hypothetical protein
VQPPWLQLPTLLCPHMPRMSIMPRMSVSDVVVTLGFLFDAVFRSFWAREVKCEEGTASPCVTKETIRSGWV